MDLLESVPVMNSETAESDLDEDALLQKAISHLERDQWNEAAEAYRRSLEFSPGKLSTLASISDAVWCMLRAELQDVAHSETRESILEKRGNFFPQKMSNDPQEDIRFHKVAALVLDACGNALAIRHLYFAGASILRRNQYRDALLYFHAAHGVFVQQTPTVQTQLQVVLFEIQRDSTITYCELGNAKMARFHLDSLPKIASEDAITMTLTTRGRVFAAEGRYEEASEAFAEAFQRSEANGREPTPAMIGNFAETSNMLGRTALAMSLWERAIAQGRRQGNATYLARCLVKLAGLHHANESFELAAQYLAEASDADKSKENELRVAHESGRLIASMAERIDQSSVKHAELVHKGVEHFEKALQLALELQLSHYAQQIMLYYGKFLYATATSMASATRLLHDAVVEGRRLSVHPRLWAQTLCAYGQCLLFEQNASEALEIFLEAESVYDAIFQTYRNDAHMVRFVNEREAAVCYDGLTWTHLLLGNAVRSLEVHEKRKSRTLSAELSRKRRQAKETPSAGNDNHGSAYMKFEDIRDYARRAKLTFVIFSATNEHEIFIVWVVHDGVESKPICFARREANIFRPSESAQQGTVVEMSKFMRRAHLTMTSARRDAQSFFVGAIEDGILSDEQAEHYYSLLWKLIEADIPADRPIVIVADGNLCKVPFCLLIDEKKRRLVEKYPRGISFAASVGALKLADDLAAAYASTAPDSALVVGNPTMPKLEAAGSLASLQGAEEEANEVAAMLISNDFATTTLLGDDATKDIVCLSMAESKIAHFATHGLQRAADGYVPGALVLARAEADAPLTNCILTSEDIQTLNLPGLKLCVLSCCHTGAGDVRHEGLLGLGRALTFAGCQCVVVARWAVPDVETRALMREFYACYLRTRDAPMALREAQMARFQHGASTADWGGFYVLGVSNEGSKTS